MRVPDDYVPVQARIHEYWAKHPDGQILTSLEHHDDTAVVFSAAVHTEGGRVLAVGWARTVLRGNEKEFEKCETVAIGRALANAGFVTQDGQRASAEEMEAAADVETIDAEQQELLKTRIVELDARYAWKDAGLPALAHLPVSRYDEAVTFLDGLEPF